MTIYIVKIMYRNESERVRNEAVRLIREREDKTVMTQRDADRRIGERLHDEVGRRKRGNFFSAIPKFISATPKFQRIACGAGKFGCGAQGNLVVITS